MRLRAAAAPGAVKAIRGKGRVPVIYITGYPDGVKADGADEYVMAKPFRREDLKQTISRALKDGPGTAPRLHVSPSWA